MINKPTTPFILLGLLLLLFTSCELDDLSESKYQPEFAFPLVQASFKVKDALSQFNDSSILAVDEDGLIHLQYTGDILTKTTEDVFESINAALGQDIPIPLTMDTTALPAAFPDGLNVDRMDLKKGNFYYILQSKNPLPVHVEIIALSLVKDGMPLTFNIDLDAYVSGDAVTATNAFFPVELNGYSLIPDEDGEILIAKNIVDSNGMPVDLELQAVVFQNLEYSYAEGYLGNYGYDQDRDTIKMDFFDSWVQGDIYFSEPTVTILFENSFGIPTRSIINTFEIQTVTGEVLPLESAVIQDGIDFPYPAINEVGVVKRTSFEFNKDNSNIDVILGAGPLALDYDVDALTNPDNDTNIIGFVTDSSYYKVQVKVDLPLYGKVLDFLTRDTFDIDMSAFDNALEGEFKIVTENSIPLGAKMQGYFLDGSGIVLDSLFAQAEGVIEAANVDVLGASVGPIKAETFVALDENKMNALKAAKQLVLSASFSTTSTGTIPAKITNNQDLAIRIGMRVKVQK